AEVRQAAAGAHREERVGVGPADQQRDPRPGRLGPGVDELGGGADGPALPVRTAAVGGQAGAVDQGDDREVVGVAGADEPGGLLAAVDVEAPVVHPGLVGDHPEGLAADAGEGAHHVGGPAGGVLEQVAAVDDGGEDVTHVVGGAVGRGQRVEGTAVAAAA